MDMKGRKSETVVLRAKSDSRITKDKDGCDFDVPVTSFSPFRGVLDFVEKYLKCDCRFVKDGFSSFYVSFDGKRVSYLLRVLKRDLDASSKEVYSPMYVKAVFGITDNFEDTDNKECLITVYSEIALLEVTDYNYFKTLASCRDCFCSRDNDFQINLCYFVRELDSVLGEFFTGRDIRDNNVILFSVVLNRFGYRFRVYNSGRTSYSGYISDGYTFKSGFLTDFEGFDEE